MNKRIVYTVKEFASVMQIGETKAYNLLRSANGPPTVKIGRCIRVPAAELEIWLSEESERQRGGATE